MILFQQCNSLKAFDEYGYICCKTINMLRLETFCANNFGTQKLWTSLSYIIYYIIDVQMQKRLKKDKHIDNLRSQSIPMQIIL